MPRTARRPFASKYWEKFINYFTYNFKFTQCQKTLYAYIELYNTIFVSLEKRYFWHLPLIKSTPLWDPRNEPLSSTLSDTLSIEHDFRPFNPALLYASYFICFYALGSRASGPQLDMRKNRQGLSGQSTWKTVEKEVSIFYILIKKKFYEK